MSTYLKIAWSEPPFYCFHGCTFNILAPSRYRDNTVFNFGSETAPSMLSTVISKRQNNEAFNSSGDTEADRNQKENIKYWLFKFMFEMK